MKETFFQLILLNLTPGISTYFSIKWKFKSYPCHSTNEDHVKENRKWGIIIIQWKHFSNMDRKIHKPEIRPQKMLFFFSSFNRVLCLVPGCKEDQDEISALSELSLVSYSWGYTLLMGAYGQWQQWHKTRNPWLWVLRTLPGQSSEESVVFTVCSVVEDSPTHNLIGKWVLLAVKEGLN